MDKARLALSQARTLPEVKKIRDIAEAAKIYAKAAQLGYQAENYAAEISLRASRKAGGFLRESPHSLQSKGGSQRLGSEKSEYAKCLVEFKISPSTAVYWQLLAGPEEAFFESYLEKKWDEEKEITAAGLIKEWRKTQPSIYPKPKGDPVEWGDELLNALNLAGLHISRLRGMSDNKHKIAALIEKLNELINSAIELRGRLNASL